LYKRSVSSRPNVLNNDSQASYLKATSSWVKRKNQIQKEKDDNKLKKEEEKKKKLQDRGFTTLGHSSSTSQNI